MEQEQQEQQLLAKAWELMRFLIENRCDVEMTLGHPYIGLAKGKGYVYGNDRNLLIVSIRNPDDEIIMQIASRYSLIPHRAGDDYDPDNEISYSWVAFDFMLPEKVNDK